jgi:uncharacterized protein GlcG (DUF336 family)
MKRLLLIGCAAAIALPAMAQTAAPRAPAPPVPSPSAALSLEAAQTAVATCKASGYTVAATVLDSAGVIRTLIAADGAAARPVDSSTHKANAALKFKDSSANLQKKAEADPAFAASIAADPSLAARAGAELLLSKGMIIGAIGVGGAPGGEKDDACALAGLAKIKDRL